jgi:hypothetical protein
VNYFLPSARFPDFGIFGPGTSTLELQNFENALAVKNFFPSQVYRKFG